MFGFSNFRVFFFEFSTQTILMRVKRDYRKLEFANFRLYFSKYRIFVFSSWPIGHFDLLKFSSVRISNFVKLWKFKFLRLSISEIFESSNFRLFEFSNLPKRFELSKFSSFRKRLACAV